MLPYWFVPMRKLRSEVELGIARQAQTELDYPLRLPGLKPFGYRLDSVKTVPRSRILARFLFRGPENRRFVLSQRPVSLPLASELAITGEPHIPVRFRGKEFTMVLGAVVGEPVDGLPWHTTRYQLLWEHEGVMCRIEAVTDSSPTLPKILRVAHSVRSLPTYEDEILRSFTKRVRRATGVYQKQPYHVSRDRKEET